MVGALADSEAAVDSPTCQAETLQEFFGCHEAQSAVHNNPTKTTTSGPMLRRAKSDFLSVLCYKISNTVCTRTRIRWWMVTSSGNTTSS
jgi:hypothetical protein